MKPRPLQTTGIVALLATAPLTSQQAADAASDRETDARLAKLETWLRSGDERLRWQGIRSCVRMGSSAVPMLTRLLEGPRRVAPAAAEALARLGPKAVECLPATIKLLKKGNTAQKRLALDVVGAVGPHDSDESGGYLTTVYNELRRRRRGKGPAHMQTSLVVDCMVRLTEDPNVGVDELITHLQGQSATHREMALDWLALRGDEARRAVPALREVLAAAKQPRQTRFRFRGPGWGWSGSTTTRNESSIRRKAALLLMQLGAGRNIPVVAHIALTRHEDPAIRQRAVLQLGSLEEKIGNRGIEALQRAVSDRDKVVSWDAITALGMIGPPAKAAVPRLRALARGPDKAKAARAAAALRQIQNDEQAARTK